jgi:septal ring factor EnvC (AmiA/AmiB activator)
MSRSTKVLGFLLVTMLGVYGCAKGPGNTGSGESQTSAKIQKLEEEQRAALAARDHFRQKLATVEAEQARLQKELDQTRAAAAAERDVLKAEVKARTGERDALITQYEAFRKTLKDLLGNAETSVGKLNLPTITPTATSASLGSVQK